MTNDDGNVIRDLLALMGRKAYVIKGYLYKIQEIQGLVYWQ